MPFCPTCGYEYRPGVHICPDCGASLVATLPDEPAQVSDEPLVAVYQAPDEFTSRLVVDMLEAAGIRALEKVERTAGYDDLDFSMRGYYSQILVFESSTQEAADLIAGFVADLDRDDVDPT
jgi:hypothetical protein